MGLRVRTTLNPQLTVTGRSLPKKKVFRQGTSQGTMIQPHLFFSIYINKNL